MQGFALVEILIALFILSLGILGITGMQLSALQHSQDAYFHNLATTQLSSFLECLRANRSSSTRNQEQANWNRLNAHLLPQGIGSYQCHQNSCVVSIQWKTKQKHLLSLDGLL